MRKPYFDASKLPESHDEYVAFVDIMGTRAHMLSSVSQTANFIFKLHRSLFGMACEHSALDIYPVMDGAYVTCPSGAAMEAALKELFFSLAKLYIGEDHPAHRFIPRAGLSYGQIIKGADIPADAWGPDDNASRAAKLADYQAKLLLGKAMIEAYAAESEACPFGVHVNENAHGRKGEDEREIFFSNWRWYESKASTYETNPRDQLAPLLLAYFDPASADQMASGDRLDKNLEHYLLVRKYFSCGGLCGQAD